MIFLWKSYSIRVGFLLSTLILMGQQTPKSDSPTQAISLGIGVLEQATNLKKTGRYREGAQKSIEAAKIFYSDGDWDTWGDSYEEAYQCALLCDSLPLYKWMLSQFNLVDGDALISKNSPIHPHSKAVILGRIAFLNHIIGNYELAANYYDKSLPYAEQGADTLQLMRYYDSAASLFWLLGDDYKALRYDEKALSLASLKKDTARLAIYTINFGNIWRSIDPRRSVSIYLRAIELMPDYAEAHTLLSKAYLEGEKNLPEAWKSAQQGLKLAEADEEKSDALHQLGRVSFEQKKHEQALNYYDQALPFAEKGYGKHHPECTKIYVFKGHALRAQNKYMAALAAYNQTLQDLLPLFVPASPGQNPTEAECTATSLWILEALQGKAQCYQAQYNQTQDIENLRQSLECSELGLTYLNKIKLRYGDDESKFSLNNYYFGSLEAALHTAFQLRQQTGEVQYAQRAFSLSEQTKAVVLAESLFKKDMKGLLGVPEALLEKERTAHANIARLELKLSQADNPSDQALAKDSLFTATRAKEDLEQQILQNYPAYSDAIFGYRAAISPDTVRQQLEDDTALLEYFLGDSSIYVFLISKEGFWAEEQALPPHFDQTLSQFLHSVNNWKFATDSAAQAEAVFKENGHALYQILLEKALAQTSAKRLFIVPDGKLSLVPFDLLLTQKYDGHWVDREVPLLIKTHAVSYRFSARKQPSSPHKATKGWGGFGLEYDDETLSAIEQPKDNNSGLALRNFGKLPFADDEIMAISNLLGGAFWLNKDATRDNFLENAGNYGVLHLAMHGFVDEKNPLHSKLLFSRTAVDKDPFVYASDLYNLQLKAGLSVLSACQSGTGTWKRGEGMMSLARAFAFAGCPSVVMSLWNVSDESTADLMLGFYRNLKAGLPKDEALRAAKLKYLQQASPEYAKPIFWASFVPIGDMDAMPTDAFSGGWSWVWWGVMGFGLLLLGWVFWRYFGRRK